MSTASTPGPLSYVQPSEIRHYLLTNFASAQRASNRTGTGCGGGGSTDLSEHPSLTHDCVHNTTESTLDRLRSRTTSLHSVSRMCFSNAITKQYYHTYGHVFV